MGRHSLGRQPDRVRRDLPAEYGQIARLSLGGFAVGMVAFRMLYHRLTASCRLP